MKRNESGASGFFVAIILILVGAGVLAVMVLFGGSSGVERSTKTTSHLATVQGALEQFAASSARLPCPANPALDTGDELRTVADPSTCQFPAGAVPWRTLGMRREDSFDAWGWKIAYRVYTGTQGSLTQDRGASMVDCDSSEPIFASGTTARSGSSGGLCLPQPAQSTSVAEFVAGKGLRVNDFGAAVTDAAYVLISHGPTGYGAFSNTGVATRAPTAGGDEATNATNISPTVPYVARASSAAGTPVESTAHFDDVLAYRKVADFVNRANLAARDWPDTALAGVRFDAARLEAAAGAPVPYGDTGRQSLVFGNATVTGLLGASNQNISFDTSGGYEGIGGASGGSGLSTGEGIRIDFTQTPKAGKFAITLTQFGTVFFGFWTERFQLQFFDGGTPRGTAIVKAGCRPEGLASFTVDPGGTFDRVEVRPLDTVNTLSLANFASNLYISEIRACIAGAVCETSLQAVANTCP